MFERSSLRREGEIGSSILEPDNCTQDGLLDRIRTP